jgi:hypothetical protein
VLLVDRERFDGVVARISEAGSPVRTPVGGGYRASR